MQHQQCTGRAVRKAACFVALCSFLTAAGVGAAAANPAPVPASNVNGVPVGPGYVEHPIRQVVRTRNNVVYVMTADDAPCQVGGRGVIHIWKGTGAQAGDSRVPTAFVEQDAANRPVSAGSGSCIFALGISAMVVSPEIRLDSADLIHAAYMDGNNGNIYYQTFSTVTNAWGPRTIVGTGGNTNSGYGWPRTGQVSLSLDVNDVPHIVYASAGSSNALRYVNKVGGTWSSPATLATGTNIMHPSMVTALDGALHVAWLDNSIATHSTVAYTHRATNGAWSAVETVTAGDSQVLSNLNNDQGPNIVTDRNSSPFVLYLDGSASGPDNYVRMRYRTSAGVWTDDTPPGAQGGPSNPNGTWYTHAPQSYCASTGDIWIFLGHDVDISPGGYEYQTGGPGNPWSAYSTLDPRNRTNTTAGTPGLDGSASVRFDPLRDNNPNIIDVLYYDENDGTAGYNHHATVYYKAVVLNSAPDTIAPSAPTSLAATPTSSTQISLSWTPSTDNVGVAGYRVFRNGTQIATTTATTYLDTSLTGNTSYTYTVTAFDAAGNVSAQSAPASATTPAVSDTTAPTTSITSPAAGATISGSSTVVTATASDNVGVIKVQLYVDNVLSGTLTAAPYSFILNTNTLSNGSHTLQTNAYDAANNVGSSAIVNIIVNNGTIGQYTLFAATSTPKVADAGADPSVELGVKFTCDIAGRVTAIKFYKATTNTGTHTVALWSSSGTLLASATSTGETASGWQTVALPSPVTITAGTTYVASYHAPNAHYSFDTNYFTAPYNSVPLHAPASAGVYQYGSTRVFPSSSYQAANYWVDAVITGP